MKCANLDPSVRYPHIQRFLTGIKVIHYFYRENKKMNIFARVTFPHDVYLSTCETTFQVAIELLITLWINSRRPFVSKHMPRLVENIQNARSYWYIIHFIHNPLMFLLDKMCRHVGTSHVSYTYPSKKTLNMNINNNSFQ